MKIAFFTENFRVPWRPHEIDTFLAGSQECSVLFARALKKAGYDVTVYMVRLSGSELLFFDEETYDGIRYTDCRNYISADLVILFKVNVEVQNAKKIVYWSSDIEVRKPYPTICLTNFHKQRNEWNDAIVIPHGIDIYSLEGNKRDKISNTGIYCSSPDRGLLPLILNWKFIKMTHPNLVLYVTYGFDNVMKLYPAEEAQKYKAIGDNVIRNCQELGIVWLGSVSRDRLEQLFWECEYWFLPLQKPDSELFCLNAVKAQYCGCIPVIFKKGALQETVGKYIDYEDFVKGNMKFRDEDTERVKAQPWSEIVKLWEEKVFCL